MSGDPGKPLPSSGASEDEADAWETEAEKAGTEPLPTPETAPAAPTKPPAARRPFKVTTFVYIFLGLLGFWMLIDTTARNSIACLLGTYSSPLAGVTYACSTGPGPLYLTIGFQSNYLLLTMALAGTVEMLITAIAYNFTTDWVKQARVQKWSSAFRKVQMEAIRSGKKDRIAALKPYQERLTRLSGEVSIAQFKGMAITYFLLILIYTWVGLVIAAATAAQQTIYLDDYKINLLAHIGTLPIPWWFVIFSLYTVPTSIIFRRILKHLWLRRYARTHDLPPARPASGTPGSSA
ncbi:MAG: EMC3/TMCO1 family protein [Thermoplasmata archaeon]